MTTSSTDIQIFDFKPVWDLSGALPVLKIYNNSSGDHLDVVSYWFIASTGGGIPFHSGAEATPDKTGVWSLYSVVEAIPQVLGHMDWSGNFFVVKGYAKDSLGAVFEVVKDTRICRPTGNNGQANNFGAGSLDVITKCEKARLYVEDKTDYSYAGNSGTILSKQIKLIYPPDGTGTIPAPKEINNQNNVLLPLTRNGAGYFIILSSVYQYDFTNNSAVIIRYSFQKPLTIQCNIDLCPLICDIQRMEERYERDGCDAEERSKMLLINSKLVRAMMAKMQPMCGVDVSEIVDEIKALGGFTCDCTGIEFNGINALLSDENAGFECSEIMSCLNEQMNTLDPTCMGVTQAEWESITAIGKFQKIINLFCCGVIADIQQAS